MTDRRGFIKASCAALALPAMAHARVTATDSAAIRVVVDGSCRDANTFAATRGINASCTGDVAQLGGALFASQTPLLFGLTRDSDYFILYQLAASRGYRNSYRGVHDYRNGYLTHRLQGAREAMRDLNDAFTRAGSAWPRALAAAVPLLCAATADEHVASSTLSVAPPHDSRGYLVSWCLRRV